ncbi:hypothetical protein E4191_05705 [Paracoccus liaowanqingii]|uniref:Uncharacterized protein n=1 Tax=Paracoccus liaowanqingii TaxID=2560053 RepID=A0A4P7HJJ8_9RHOB|nr:hypothetical protein [Paracoccus liaowanqingii]QBX34266.1 hypothetical protein E4191_05705 [Paracoccus liaowanqingii]
MSDKVTNEMILEIIKQMQARFDEIEAILAEARKDQRSFNEEMARLREQQELRRQNRTHSNP